MTTFTRVLMIGSLTLGLATAGYSQETAKQDMKDAGKATKKAVVKTGQATKKVAVKTADATVHGAEKAGSAVKHGTTTAVHGTAKAVEKGATKVADKTKSPTT